MARQWEIKARREAQEKYGPLTDQEVANLLHNAGEYFRPPHKGKVWVIKCNGQIIKGYRSDDFGSKGAAKLSLQMLLRWNDTLLNRIAQMRGFDAVDCWASRNANMENRMNYNEARSLYDTNELVDLLIKEGVITIEYVE